MWVLQSEWNTPLVSQTIAGSLDSRKLLNILHLHCVRLCVCGSMHANGCLWLLLTLADLSAKRAENVWLPLCVCMCVWRERESVCVIAYPQKPICLSKLLDAILVKQLWNECSFVLENPYQSGHWVMIPLFSVLRVLAFQVLKTTWLLLVLQIGLLQLLVSTPSLNMQLTHDCNVGISHF